jgi:hypothetical protein
VMAITGLRPSHASCSPEARVRGADRLGKAESRPSGDAGVAIGHVGDGLLAMPEHALHTERAELDQCPADHRVDEENVRGAVGG